MLGRKRSTSSSRAGGDAASAAAAAAAAGGSASGSPAARRSPRVNRRDVSALRGGRREVSASTRSLSQGGFRVKMPLQLILRTKLGLRYFRNHTRAEHSEECILFWLAVGRLRRMPADAVATAVARDKAPRAGPPGASASPGIPPLHIGPPQAHAAGVAPAVAAAAQGGAAAGPLRRASGAAMMPTLRGTSFRAGGPPQSGASSARSSVTSISGNGRAGGHQQPDGDVVFPQLPGLAGRPSRVVAEEDEDAAEESRSSGTSGTSGAPSLRPSSASSAGGAGAAAEDAAGRLLLAPAAREADHEHGGLSSAGVSVVASPSPQGDGSGDGRASPEAGRSPAGAAQAQAQAQAESPADAAVRALGEVVEDEVRRAAQHIWDQYVQPKAPFAVSLDYEIRESLTSLVERDELTAVMYNEAQENALKELKADVLLRFWESRAYDRFVRRLAARLGNRLALLREADGGARNGRVEEVKPGLPPEQVDLAEELQKALKPGHTGRYRYSLHDVFKTVVSSPLGWHVLCEYVHPRSMVARFCFEVDEFRTAQQFDIATVRREAERIRDTWLSSNPMVPALPPLARHLTSNSRSAAAFSAALAAAAAGTGGGAAKGGGARDQAPHAPRHGSGPNGSVTVLDLPGVERVRKALRAAGVTDPGGRGGPRGGGGGGGGGGADGASPVVESCSPSVSSGGDGGDCSGGGGGGDAGAAPRSMMTRADLDKLRALKTAFDPLFAQAMAHIERDLFRPFVESDTFAAFMRYVQDMREEVLVYEMAARRRSLVSSMRGSDAPSELSMHASMSDAPRRATTSSRVTGYTRVLSTRPQRPAAVSTGPAARPPSAETSRASNGGATPSASHHGQAVPATSPARGNGRIRGVWGQGQAARHAFDSPTSRRKQAAARGNGAAVGPRGDGDAAPGGGNGAPGPNGGGGGGGEEKMPNPYSALSTRGFREILRTVELRKLFTEFCRREHSHDAIMFWEDAEKYRMSRPRTLKMARDIFERYIEDTESGGSGAGASESIMSYPSVVSPDGPSAGSSRPESFLPSPLQARRYTLPIGVELRNTVQRRLAAYERRLERFERSQRGDAEAAAEEARRRDDEDPSDTDDDDDEFGAPPAPAPAVAATAATPAGPAGQADALAVPEAHAPNASNFSRPRKAALMQRAPQPPADLFMEVSLRMINVMRGDPFQRFIRGDLFRDYLARRYPAEEEEVEPPKKCCIIL